MDEKLTANKLKLSIQAKVAVSKTRLKAVFLIFFSIFKPADKIKKTTQICIPLNADATQVIVKNSLKNKEIKNIMQKEGSTIPTVAKIEPKSFSFL